MSFRPEPDPALLAGPALVRPARCAVGAALEMRVAVAAIAAAAEHDSLAGLVEVGDQRFAVVIEDLGAEGDADQHVLGRGPGAVRPGAVAALRGAEMLGVAEVDQRVEVLDRLEDDVPAAPAIAAIRAAELHELLPAECDDSVAAITGADIDLGLVEKLHNTRAVQTKTGAGLLPTPVPLRDA